MSNFSLELGDEIADIGCSECGGTHKSAYGFNCKDGDAYSIYYATLHTGHEKPSIGLTISVGKWWDDEAVDERHWAFLRVWSTTDDFEMEILEPELSHHHNYKALGKKLNREDALRSPVLSEIFEVADFVVKNDPVVNRYSETGDTGTAVVN